MKQLPFKNFPIFLSVPLAISVNAYAFKGTEGLLGTEAPDLKKVSSDLNLDYFQVYSDSLEQDLPKFLEFIDSHYTDENIIPADKEQLARIAALVEDVVCD